MRWRHLLGRGCSSFSGRLIPAHIVRPPYLNRAEPNVPATSEIQSTEQIAHVRSACVLVRHILAGLHHVIKAGVTTADLDDWVFEKCIEAGVYPSPLGYHGFPRSICTSVNSVACHGIPSEEEILEDGDIISVDVTVYNGFAHGDACETFVVGEDDKSMDHLRDIAFRCREAGISVCQPGTPFHAIGDAVENAADEEGFSVVPNIRGHGIGAYFHGPPDICHHRLHDGIQSQEVMKPGMVFTVEPCITEGSGEVGLLDDGWTVVTVDAGRCAQFEHTLLITDDGFEVLTS